MLNALTIDVEDNNRIVARDWLGQDGPPTEAVVRNTHRILELLAGRRIRATFFVLGDVATTFPQLVRTIAAQGHEIGVHGLHHDELFRLCPDRFRCTVGDAKAVLEDVAGLPAIGHRAPAFSLTPKTRWALDILAELGFAYDSSVFPFRRNDRYGWAGFSLEMTEITLEGGRRIIEVPLSMPTVWGRRFPACGGGYLRRLPYAYTAWAMRRVGRDRPAVVYLHPYELDSMPTPGWLQAALVGARCSVRLQVADQQWNRRTVESKFTRLLKEFQFAPLVEVIERTLGRHVDRKTPRGNSR
jgi:polysaccharide deacetylase family protein (PEP-CTERM system associated)